MTQMPGEILRNSDVMIFPSQKVIVAYFQPNNPRQAYRDLISGQYIQLPLDEIRHFQYGNEVPSSNQIRYATTESKEGNLGIFLSETSSYHELPYSCSDYQISSVFKVSNAIHVLVHKGYPSDRGDRAIYLYNVPSKMSVDLGKAIPATLKANIATTLFRSRFLAFSDNRGAGLIDIAELLKP